MARSVPRRSSSGAPRRSSAAASPGAVLGWLTGLAAFVAVGMALNYRQSFTATLGPPVTAIMVVLTLGTIAIAVHVLYERRARGLQVPPDCPGSEDGSVPFPIPAMWLPWGALGLFAALEGLLLSQGRLWWVGLAWAGVGLLGALTTVLVRRRRLYRPWKPAEPGRLTRRTVVVARRLLTLREAGLGVAAAVPGGRDPARVVAVDPRLRERTWLVDSVADGDLAIRMAGLVPTPPFTWDSAVSALREARSRPPAPRSASVGGSSGGTPSGAKPGPPERVRA